MRKRAQFLSLTILMILIGTTACQPEETELLFETIERRPYGSTGKLWRAQNPGFVTVATPDDLAQVNDFFTFDAHAQLQNLDFERHFAVVVFQGFQGSLLGPPFGVEVQKIIKEGGTVKIHAHIYEHVGEVVRRPVQNSPYHLVQVRREEDMRGEIEFVLIVDGTVMSRQSHRLPFATPGGPPPTPTPPLAEETHKALQYIAEREGVSIEPLVVVAQQRREYESLGRVFWAVRVLDTQNDRWYDVLLDLADGSFVDDMQAIEQAELEAHRARYGKLEPALFERLETLNADDDVPVVIWVVGKPRKTRRELFAEPAAKYPEVQAALERSGNPFDVDDYELINKIENEYVRLVEADTQERVQPLAGHLEEQGYVVTTLGALPAIAVSLPKAALLELVSRTDVGAVDLNEDAVKRR